MKIVGRDLHTRYQEIAMLDDETGELIERRLERANGEAKEFYDATTNAADHALRWSPDTDAETARSSTVPAGVDALPHRQSVELIAHGIPVRSLRRGRQ
jgi:hypothetical protein